MIRTYRKREIYFSMSPPDRPLGPLQVIIGLFQLPDVFVQLILDATRLAEVVLQHRDLLVALRVLLLQFVLNTGKEKRKHSTYRSRQCVCSCEDAADQLPTQSSSDVCCYSVLHQTALQCYINSAAQMPFTLPVQWP